MKSGELRRRARRWEEALQGTEGGTESPPAAAALLKQLLNSYELLSVFWLACLLVVLLSTYPRWLSSFRLRATVNAETITFLDREYYNEVIKELK